MERPDVFKFKNFREYLREMYEYKHSLDHRFTKAKICRDMGLMNTRSYFQNILNGKFLTIVKTNLLIESFELSPHEGKYLKVLVNFNQAFDDPDEKGLYFDQMLSLRKATGIEISEEQYSYYKKWHHSAVRMLLSIVNVSEDIRQVQKHLLHDISLKEIEKSIALLKELKLIAKNDEGFYKPTETIIQTPAYCRNELVKGYQIDALKEAQKSLLSDYDFPKNTITKMLSFSEEGYSRVMGAVERFSNEINVIVSEDEDIDDRIYQMILTLFPFSQGIEK